MYAQLCRRLNELVPNFEEPGSQSTVGHVTRATCHVTCYFILQTFRKLLLHKCQEEFENRRVGE